MKKIAGKIILLFVIFSVLAPAGFTLAQTESAAPSNNPMCWKKDECTEARDGKTNGWVQEDPCVGDYGKCLPAGVTKTAVSFGGETQFSNAGDFVKKIYNFSMVAIQILAVVMIIIAGAQWASSAGNTETISKAKKRITGAVIGMLIASMSYIILNSINTATVNLRLPQVWMIRPSVETPPEPGEWCDYTGGPSKEKCESDGTMICRKVGWEKDLRGPCMVAAEIYVDVLMIIGTGGIGAGGSTIGSIAGKAGVSGLKFVAQKAAQKLIQSELKVAASEIAKYTTKETAKKALLAMGSKVISFKTIAQGTGAVIVGTQVCPEIKEQSYDTLSCGKIAASAAEGIVEIAVEDIPEFFSDHLGQCMKKPAGLIDGEMCNVAEPQQCAGGKCVKVEGVSEFFKCWSTIEVGFCSSGQNKSICHTNADCADGRRCVEQYVPQCSDGGLDSPCLSDDDCNIGGLTCSVKSAAFTDIAGRCIGAGTMGGFGSMCKTKFECSNANGSCYAVTSDSGNLSSLVTDMSGEANTNWGIVDMTSGGLWYGYGICGANTSFSELGPTLGSKAFFKGAKAYGWTGSNMKQYTLCYDDSTCGGKTCQITGGSMGVCQ